jgi:hypothetical protein
VPKKLRFVLFAAVVLLALPAATAARAVSRMPIGFFDDPSFRWATGPGINSNLAGAQAANGSIIHVLVNWAQVAPSQPANPLNGNDKAYRLNDIDNVVQMAPKYGLQVLLTITGTPAWANGGRPPDYAPTSMSTLTQFAQMLAARYSGRKAGTGVVNLYSVWNEPNLQLFLAPQFRGSTIVSPAIYVKLWKAAYTGIKAGNPSALVAAGETSNRGHNHPTGGVSDSVAPATFAHMVSLIDPNLPFVAWATHPYPSSYLLGPAQKVAYPNVGFSTMVRFGTDLQKWFKRRVPIWVTEYGEQTTPEYPFGGVSYAVQAAHARQALQLAAADPYVQMFVWFIFRDSNAQTWFSGIEQASGAKKPAYATFKSTASGIVGQSLIVAPGKPFSITVTFPILNYYNGAGSKIGSIYKVTLGSKVVAIAQPLLTIQTNGTVSIPINFAPVKGQTYQVAIAANDKGGHTEGLMMVLLPSTPAPTTALTTKQ